MLAGEAKWQVGRVGRDALAQLKDTARFAPGYGPETMLALYARDGFSAELRDRASEGAIILRTVDDLYS